MILNDGLQFLQDHTSLESDAESEPFDNEISWLGLGADSSAGSGRGCEERRERERRQ